MAHPIIADVRLCCNTPSNTSAAAAYACRLGYERVLAEAVLCPAKGEAPAALLFVPHHITDYQKLWQTALPDWMVSVGLHQGLDYPDELGALLDVKGLRELWIYCRAEEKHAGVLMKLLRQEDEAARKRLVVVLPHVRAKVKAPCRVCSPHASANIGLLQPGTAWRRPWLSALLGKPMLSLAHPSSRWSHWRVDVMP